jgi:DUF1365 family protein
MTAAGLRIAFGHVMHRRLRPAAHAFRYPVFSLHLRLQDLETLPAGGGWLFARDRFALLAVHAVDHGPRDGTPLLPWIRGLLAREGVVADGDIWLQTFPRVLGYVFNPVSFWYCHDRAGGLRAVLAEVNNTFGERHNYLLVPPSGGNIDATTTLSARKVFHVSPFMAVRGAYRFRFRTSPDEVHSVRIDLADERGDLLHAVITGRPQPLTRAALLRAFFAYPMQSFGVIARIHWQALQLWWKRVPFHAKPEPPLEETTR